MVARLVWSGVEPVEEVELSRAYPVDVLGELAAASQAVTGRCVPACSRRAWSVQ